MKPLQCLSRLSAVALASLLLLFGSGCVTISPDEYEAMLRYQPVRIPAQINASASVEVHTSFTPEMHASWASMNNETSIANYLQAEEHCIANDLLSSGLFARIEAGPEDRPEFHLKATSVEASVPEYSITVTLTMTEASSGRTVSEHARTVVFGKSIMDCKVQEALPGLLAALKNDIASDWLAKARAAQHEADKRAVAAMENQPLAELLASSDRNAFIAAARNRALIAAKNQQLPGLLRESKTSELTALVTKIEQTILDLNHECELAQDKLQKAMPAGGSWIGLELGPGSEGSLLVKNVMQGGPADQAGFLPGDIIVAANGSPLPDVQSFVSSIRTSPTGTVLHITCQRQGNEIALDVTTAPRPETAGSGNKQLDLALCYRDRIELLKPILSTLKEELANRSR